MNGFTQVLNELITDKRISAAAKCVAVYLASKPEGWIPREANIMNALAMGRTQYLRAVRELDAAGYIARGKTTRSAGKIRREPFTLNRERVSPGRTEVTFQNSGNRTPVTRPVTNTRDQHKTELLTSRNVTSVKAPDLLPQASEGASAPERQGLRVSTCKVCIDALDLDLRPEDVEAFHSYHVDYDRSKEPSAI